MNTVRALECLAFTALSAPQLADSLQVSVRTARRLLKRLAIEGFVIQERDHRRRYHPTLRLAALGQQMLDHAPLNGPPDRASPSSLTAPHARHISGSPLRGPSGLRGPRRHERRPADALRLRGDAKRATKRVPRAGGRSDRS
jgi:hypothetical protein